MPNWISNNMRIRGDGVNKILETLHNKKIVDGEEFGFDLRRIVEVPDHIRQTEDNKLRRNWLWENWNTDRNILGSGFDYKNGEIYFYTA